MESALLCLRKNCSGPIAALVADVIIGAVTAAGDSFSTNFNSIATDIGGMRSTSTSTIS